MRIWIVGMTIAAASWGAAHAQEASYKEKTAALLKVLGKKNAKVEEVTDCIDAVADGYAEASDKEKEAGIKAIGKAAKSKDKDVVLGAFEALGLLQAPGTGKYLKRHLSIPKKGPYTKLQKVALETAKEIGDKSILGQLRKLADHKLDEVAVDATEALGGYKRLPVKDRKALAIGLITRLQKLSVVSGGSRGYGRGLAESTAEKTEETGTPDGRIGSDGKADGRRTKLYSATRAALCDLTDQRFAEVGDWVGWAKDAKAKKDPFG